MYLANYHMILDSYIGVCILFICENVKLVLFGGGGSKGLNNKVVSYFSGAYPMLLLLQ